MIRSVVSFYLNTITKRLKIDLTKENKKITNSLGVVIGEVDQERIIATEILEKVIQVARIQRTSYRRVEDGCAVISQTTKISVVRLPYCAELTDKADPAQ